MKKRILLLLCLCIMLIFTGCCSHNYSNATCTDPQTCKKCGEIKGDALGHDYSNATCTDPQTCNRCEEIGEEMLGHDFMPATYEAPATCTRCEITVGDKLKPVSEWGFYNLNEMGYALVSITGYNLEDKDNAHVYFHESASVFKFENNYKLSWSYDIKDGKCLFGATGSPEKYKIVNNDCIDLNNGWDSINIEKRLTSSNRENFVVFVEDDMFGEKWYIPYSLIDWERGISDDPTSDDKYDFILYLNP